MRNHKAVVVIRKVLPPVLTIGASAAILGGAYWYHQNQQQQNTSLLARLPGSVNSISTEPPMTSDTTSTHEGSNPSNNTAKSNSTTNAAEGKDKESTSKDSSTKNKTSDNETTGTQTPSGDQGFAPVSGGVLTASPNPENGNLILSHPFSSVVTQYGANPQTTFDASKIQLQFGLNIKLDSSLKASAHQVVLIPLRYGVLWAVIPTGTNQSTTLYYTIYGQASSAKEVVLSPKAQKLGVIPAQVISTGKPQTSWYSPGARQTAQGGNNNTAKSGPSNSGMIGADSILGGSFASANTNTTSNSAGNNVTNSTGNSTTNNTGTVSTQQTAYQWNSAMIQAAMSSTDATPNIQTIADSGNTTRVALNGLYRVEGGVGAVITLNTDAGTWAYYWDESKQALIPICSIANTATERGWIAIGSQTVYWGQRALIPPDMKYYQGSQHMMNLSTKKTYSIKLGSWTDSGFVKAGKDLSSTKPDGHTNEDNLYFRVKNSETWKEFIPNKH